MAKRNRRKIIITTIFYILVFLPLISFLAWVFTPRKPMNILIMDKTVLTQEGQEHQSFNWILKNLKFTRPDKHFYDIAEDYKGFFPKENEKFEINDFYNWSSVELDSLANNLDMAYYTDSYGMYYNEWYRKEWETEHSEKIYGGLDKWDLYLLRRMKEKGKLIVAEFNFFHHPTPYGIRRGMEKTFDLKWSGWTARYFDSLDTITNPELPRWVIRLYKQQNQNTWPFKQDGIVFVHENSTICILENKINLEYPVPVINTMMYAQKRFGLPETMNYPYWVDITFPVGKTNRVLSYYQIKTNFLGDSLLNKYGIPSTFPALFEHLGDYRFYYFAGDFCDNNIANRLVWFKWIDHVVKGIYPRGRYNDHVPFFWNYYIPIMKKILREEYEIIQAREKLKKDNGFDG